MATSPQELLTRLRDAQIVPGERLDAILQEVDLADSENGMKSLLTALIRAELLTKFQATYLLQNRGDQLRLGNYVLQEKIGRGGMGTVYRARHSWMDRTVAVKILNDVQGDDPRALKRFQREVQAAARLIHPNIVTAFDADQTGDRWYLVMEYVRSEDLVSVVAHQGPLGLARAVHCLIQAARGLQYAHDQGVVHRDIKPSNMLLDESGTLKILDMGLARFAEPAGDLLSPPEPNQSSLTRLNQIMGTVDFMSPEQAEESSRADARSDIYSLGCTLFFLLTGSPPYRRSSVFKTLLAHRLDPIPSLRERRPDLPEAIDELFRRLVAKDPADRLGSMTEVVRALQPFDDDSDFELAPDASLVDDAPEDTRVLEADPDGSGIFDGQAVGLVATKPVPQPVTPPPSDSRAAIGIDLGTTYTVLSYVDEGSQPRTVPNREGEVLTPSLVYFAPWQEVLVGREAEHALGRDLKHVAENAKRDLGSAGLERVLYGQAFPPEVILALILRKVRADAEARLGPIDTAVITVPAYFDETRRVATQHAGWMAGLNVLDIINEPTAAALAFGIETFGVDADFHPLQHGERVLIYDLGGGTFDVTVLQYDAPYFRTLATDGDVELGGLDWDQRLLDFIAETCRPVLGKDLRDQPATLGPLKLECDHAKRVLSERDEIQIAVRSEDQEHWIKLTRETFEDLTADLLLRTEFTVAQTVQQAGLTWNDIDRIFIIGGASKMPAVAKMLKKLSGKEPVRAPFPDEVVSHGAALHAHAILARREGKQPRVKVRNVNSHSLGVVAFNPKTQRQETSILIPKNTPLPTIAKKIYKTKQTGQSKLIIPIVEGESKDPAGCSPLGRCVVEHLPPDLPKGSPVQISFTYRQNARLSLSVTVAGQSWTQRIQRYSGLTSRQLGEWKAKLDEGRLFDVDELGFAEFSDS